MPLEKDLANLIPPRETILTIGVFDGVHLGHHHLLRHLLLRAQQENLLSGVVTFDRHPQTILSPQTWLSWLTTLEDRTTLLRKFGVELIVVLPFTREIAQISAGNFVQLLKQYLKMRRLVIGPDFALGKEREGNVSRLQALGQEIGFSVEVVSPVVLDGVVISSTAIREALAYGDMKRVEKLVGRPFSFTGEVVPGAGRGRALGFPTANLEAKPEQALPRDGIYATISQINQELFPSVTNIGIRPTFGGGKHIVEVYLLDYEGELYGEKLRIDFIDRLRDEKRFESAEQLKAQIRRDVEQARLILSHKMKNKEAHHAIAYTRTYPMSPGSPSSRRQANDKPPG